MAKSTCGGCKFVFQTVPAFEAHRTGSHRLKQRRCLTVEEMLASGLIHETSKNEWYLEAEEMSPEKKENLRLKHAADARARKQDRLLKKKTQGTV